MSIELADARVLRALHVLLQRGWTQQAEARDKNEDMVIAVDPNACSWCMLGGLEYLCRTETQLERLIERLAVAIDDTHGTDPATNRLTVIQFNDGLYRKQREVLTLVDRVALKLESTNA